MFKSKFSYWFTEVEIKDVSRLHSRSYEVTGEVCVVELEMSLVVELEKGGRVGMLLLQMDVVNLRLFSGEAAVLADVHLVTQRYEQLFLSSQFYFSLPSTSSACTRIDEQLREPSSSGFLENISEWRTSRRDCICRDGHLKW